ncbi:tetratricopeptide repeat protein [Limibacter armeniacum]|uniref:tetratricopeptide repeat protein n=1 Tax=Limibacter armeniacum TaxID=466084 RepID=UPI002FE529FE
MIDSALQHFKAKRYNQSIALLRQSIKDDNAEVETYQLLAKCHFAKGNLNAAVKTVRKGLQKLGETPALWESLLSYNRRVKQLEDAFREISKGLHTSANINFLRNNIRQLIEHQCFEESIVQLRRATEVRKHKTTTILWIGQYLKEVYFSPYAEDYREHFDELLLDEILFYYLKSCKMFEKGFGEVQKARQKLDMMI